MSFMSSSVSFFPATLILLWRAFECVFPAIFNYFFRRPLSITFNMLLWHVDILFFLHSVIIIISKAGPHAA